MAKKFVDLRVSDEDAQRILRTLKDRNRRLNRGIEKFGENFDPVKGANMLAGREAYTNLINSIEEQI